MKLTMLQSVQSVIDMLVAMQLREEAPLSPTVLEDGDESDSLDGITGNPEDNRRLAARTQAALALKRHRAERKKLSLLATEAGSISAAVGKGALSEGYLAASLSTLRSKEAKWGASHSGGERARPVNKVHRAIRLCLSPLRVAEAIITSDASGASAQLSRLRRVFLSCPSASSWQERVLSSAKSLSESIACPATADGYSPMRVVKAGRAIRGSDLRKQRSSPQGPKVYLHLLSAALPMSPSSAALPQK